MKSPETITYKEAIRRSMSDALQNFDHTVVMGQGVTDLTSIFGTVAGLVEKHGKERVIEMAIAEEGMTGFGIGAALNGVYPIQTHIRVDFLVLAMNQVVNHLAKYKYMYGGAFEVPMLIRAVVGRSWGQGPQHSQSLQSLFSHIPGLKVIMPSSANSVYHSYLHAIKTYRGPVLSIEHRFLYDNLFHFDQTSTPENPFASQLIEEGKDLTIVATSYLVQEAQRASKWLKENLNFTCDIIDPHLVSTMDHDSIYQSILKTGRLIIADTSWLPYGVVAEVCRGIVTRNPAALKAPVLQLGMAFTPTPTSHSLEKFFYPDMGDIVNAAYTLVSGNKDHGEKLPSDEFKKEQQKKFKGPF